MPALRSFAVALSACVLVACGGGGGGGTGTLRLALTDAPACGWESVNVTIEKVRVHRSADAGEGDAGWSELVLAPPRRVDLLTLTNGVLAELGQMPLAEGKYTQMRLVLAANAGATPLANSVVPVGGGEMALKTPSGQHSGAKMNVNIDIAANQMADVVIDFDACRSVVRAGASGQVLLKPVINVLPRFVSGAQGHVDATIAGTATVSLQRDGVVVKSTVPDTAGKFVLQPVAPGTYDLVIAAPGRATAVVTGVVVAADTVAPIGGTAIVPPASPTGTARGTVNAPADASAVVRATQSLAGGRTIEVASEAVAAGAEYQHVLSVAAPVVAAFGPVLSFTPAAAAAGRFTLEATSGTTTRSAALNLAGGATVTNDFTFP